MTPIVLDTTIADLYRENGIDNDLLLTMYCVFGHMDLHPNWPAETVYPEDEEPVPYGADETEKTRLRKIIMGLKVVKRCFVAGDMNVLFLQPFVTADNIDLVYARLSERQRPRPAFVDLDAGNVKGQLSKATANRKLLIWRPQGWHDEYDCLVSPALAYEINSKKYLITSGIRTPQSTMMNLRDDETRQTLEARSLPFVVKLPLAGCGFGTHIVTSEERRETMQLSMGEYAARGGSEIMISDYIDLVHDLSVHLFVGAPGSANDKYKPRILGVTVQNLTSGGHWLGGSIDYSMQEHYNGLLDRMVRDTTARLPDKYVGWCGLDIVIDKEGEQWVVDLNARFTGSMPICLLSNHFFVQRGLSRSEFATFKYAGDVQMAYDVLESELDRGDVIINAIVGIDQELTAVDLVWGGNSAEDLQQKAAYIRRQLRIA